ncbi:MAG: L-lactate permease [Corynebacterium sp.]|nr:L-lactate permease [Corynebacterium sp.]
MLFVTDPTIVAGSIWATAAVSIVPLIAFFFFLMGLKWHVHWSAIAATAIAAVSATTVFRMPPLLVGASFSQGFTYGFFPIVLCIWMAIWIHDVTVVSGRFADLRTLIGEIGPVISASRPFSLASASMLSLSPSPVLVPRSRSPLR